MTQGSQGIYVDAHAEDTLRRDVRLGYSLPPRRSKELLAILDALRAENERLRVLNQMALLSLRDSVPDSCACVGAKACDRHELITDLEAETTASQ